MAKSKVIKHSTGMKPRVSPVAGAVRIMSRPSKGSLQLPTDDAQRQTWDALEAISMAGDLSIYGKRDAIFVIREENGERVTHWVDIRSKDLFNSPVYYLKQNDVVYVQPNKVRAGQSTINENSVKSVSLWISIGSFLSSLGVLLFK